MDAERKTEATRGIPPEATSSRLHDDAPPDPPSEATPAAAFRAVARYVGELSEYAKYYLAAKSDALKLSLRRAAIMAAVGVVGLIAAGAVVVVCVTLFL